MLRFLVLALWCAAFAAAQPLSHKEPAVYHGTEHSSTANLRPPGIRLGLPRPVEFALPALNDSETGRLTQFGVRQTVGVHRPLSDAALSNGAWVTTAGGERIWRVALRSRGAQAIRLEFRDFSIGAGKLWLHDGSTIAGPYTGRGIYGDGHFWSEAIFSESVILEYEPAPGTPETATPPFHIRNLAHRAIRVAPRSVTDTPQAAVADTADFCHLDPNCYPDWQPAMSMVAQLLFEDSGLEYFCSGSAIATRDDSFKPYLLTAGHCIHSEDAARTLETFWTYQTSSCGGSPPDRQNSTKSSLGAHLIGSGGIEDGDYSLVLLRDLPSGVTFAGWDTSDPAASSSVTGMHHPNGSWKRISFGNRVGDASAELDGGIAPANLYLQVQWAQGRTEPGSSGSPLFSSPGVIVGTLTYGPYSPEMSACEISPSIDGYGRFSNTYYHLSDYFENLPAAEVLPVTSDLTFSVLNKALPGAQTVQLNTQSPGQIAFKLRADAPWIQISSPTGTVSANVPATVQISIDPTKFDKPDLYTSTVTILSGAAPPQFINVAANVRLTASNVVPAIAPNPVVKSGGQWQFTISLAETGGAATHLTTMKVNGTDYSSSIAAWFGATEIGANATLQAPLTAAGLFAPGNQYFEFWGVDDDGGQQWYRVTTVAFQ